MFLYVKAFFVDILASCLPFSPILSKMKQGEDRPVLNGCSSLVFVDHVALINFGWLYDETQECLLCLNGFIHLEPQTDQHSLRLFVCVVKVQTREALDAISYRT